MNPITYSLNPGGQNSELYYSEINTLADLVMEKSRDSMQKIIDGYIDYIHNYNLEEVCEREEYLLELLSFGIL